MKIGIVGLPQSGKTTIYNILTGAAVETGGYHAAGQDATNIHVVKVADERLDKIHSLFPDKKEIYTIMEFIDVAGIVKAEGTKSDQEKAVFSHLIGIDMLMVILRVFKDDNILHPEGSIDPARDMDIFQTELLLRDLNIVENRLRRLTKAKKKPSAGTEKMEWELLEKCQDSLSREQFIRGQDLNPAEKKYLRSYQLMTEKPLLVVLNIGENDIDKKEELAGQLEDKVSSKRIKCVSVCGKLEMELAQMEEEEALEFMDAYGITEPASTLLTGASKELLNLITFFTIGDKEVRAWSVARGIHAREAAGTVHSDMEKGFIRAEVVHWEDLIKRGSLSKCKDDGVLRLEGKNYEVKDGEIIYYRFNV